MVRSPKLKIEEGEELSLAQALAWIATREARFVHAIPNLTEWTINERLDQLASQQAVPMRFAASASEAWEQLRSKLSNGNVIATGIHARRRNPELPLHNGWPSENVARTRLLETSAHDHELVELMSMALRPRGLMRSDEKWWFHVRINRADLENAFPSGGEAQKAGGAKPSRAYAKNLAIKIAEKLFPNESARRGISKKVVIQHILNEPEIQEKEISDKTVRRALRERWPNWPQ